MAASAGPRLSCTGGEGDGLRGRRDGNGVRDAFGAGRTPHVAVGERARPGRLRGDAGGAEASAAPGAPPGQRRARGPNELEAAARDVEIAVLAANSAGARSLASMVREHVAGARVAVSVAKGLEPTTGKRMSEVYGEELSGVDVVVVGGPCLARELAEGLPTAAVWAASVVSVAERRGQAIRRPSLSALLLRRRDRRRALLDDEERGRDRSRTARRPRQEHGDRLSERESRAVHAGGARDRHARDRARRQVRDGDGSRGDRRSSWSPASAAGTASTGSWSGPAIRRTTPSASWRPAGSRWKAWNRPGTCGASHPSAASSFRITTPIHRVLFDGARPHEVLEVLR